MNFSSDIIFVTSKTFRQFFPIKNDLINVDKKRSKFSKMYFKKCQKLFYHQQNLDQEKSKNMLRLVFCDYSCVFSRKISRNVFLLSTLLWQYIRHWLGKRSLEFVEPLGAGWTRHGFFEVFLSFGFFLVQILLLAK